MSSSSINKKLKILEKAILNDILEKISSLDLDEETVEKIKKVTEKPKRKAPKTPAEKQCKKLTKKGEKCTIAACYKESCWVHLSKEDKVIYKKIKDEK